MCRTNSCSTRSRSSRIGSKICARSAVTGSSARCRSRGCRQVVGFTILDSAPECQRAKPLRAHVTLDAKSASKLRVTERPPAARSASLADRGERLERRARRSAGSFRLPRCGTGARYGLSVSTSSRSAGTIFAASRRSAGLRKRHDAGEREVKAEVERRAAPSPRRR